ncbi:hypothetical protein UF72_1698 [Staphylococcus equorum subsp. equorum]|nr:hypothetical protein SE1039_26620 [Staphylococcus equorum]ANK38618.1 hypothetical protein AOB58_1816 [Staphylococcus sp. AntiMn-1]EJX19311.1 hypothetical protein SOJ_02500 [Staphylococcus sp. OJ82]KKI53876.1 hypothetical protein UF72_1698 [Staphylococcus equorum subsp. equorum]
MINNTFAKGKPPNLFYYTSLAKSFENKKDFKFNSFVLN